MFNECIAWDEHLGVASPAPCPRLLSSLFLCVRSWSSPLPTDVELRVQDKQDSRRQRRRHQRRQQERCTSDKEESVSATIDCSSGGGKKKSTSGFSAYLPAAHAQKEAHHIGLLLLLKLLDILEGTHLGCWKMSVQRRFGLVELI